MLLSRLSQRVARRWGTVPSVRAKSALAQPQMFFQESRYPERVPFPLNPYTDPDFAEAYVGRAGQRMGPANTSLPELTRSLMSVGRTPRLSPTQNQSMVELSLGRYRCEKVV